MSRKEEKEMLIMPVVTFAFAVFFTVLAIRKHTRILVRIMWTSWGAFFGTLIGLALFLLR